VYTGDKEKPTASELQKMMEGVGTKGEIRRNMRRFTTTHMNGANMQRSKVFAEFLIFHKQKLFISAVNKNLFNICIY
jgi:hypothetical protein